MSSLALVPYKFPLLKLPFLALQNVADFLNPFEIYHFSRISKRTKKLAKLFSKKATVIFLTPPFRVLIEFKESEKGSFEPIIEPGPDQYIFPPKRSLVIYRFFSKNPTSEALRVLERVIDLFKNSNVHLIFDARLSSRQNLIFYFNWLMMNPFEVPYVAIRCYSAEDVLFFLKNYKKASKKLDLRYQSEGQLELPDNLEITLFEEVEIQNFHAVNFNLYNIFSCPTIDSVETLLTNNDLNLLLKNWQLGLTNSHWRSVCIQMLESMDLKDVLKDITATYRDPRTVKRQISATKGSCWIFGGIDIQKHDGSGTATIQWKKYRVENVDSEVPNKFIEEYERNQESGEIQSHENENFPKFSMFLW